MRLKFVKRDNQFGLWFPAYQQWWEISEDALLYFKGEALNDSVKNEIVSELQKMDVYDELIKSQLIPINESDISKSPSFRPPTVTILHSTWKCNEDCPDCYIKRAQNGNSEELTTIGIKTFLKSFSEAGGLFADISGGEALLRNDIFEILKYSYDLNLRTCLVTNGTLITKDVAKKLSTCVDQVTISIDGLEVEHEKIRGENNYVKSLNALSYCVQSNISTGATTVLRNLSFKDLEKILIKLSDIGIEQWNLTALRRPWNNNNLSKNRPLNKQEIVKLGQEATKRGVEIVMDEALIEPKFRKDILDIKIEQEEQRWHSTLTVLPNGDVVPCVFHPHAYSNVKFNNAREISESSKRKELLSRVYKTECENCLK